MRIGEVAARSGVSVRSLRYYEEQGLLMASRSSSGQRHYGEAAVERVRLIQVFFAAGLSSTTIHGLLPCMDTGIASEDTWTLLVAERARIDRQLSELTAVRAKLDELIAAKADPALTCPSGESAAPEVA